MGGGGGVDLKMGGGIIHSKVILLPEKILNKTSNFCPNVSKVLSKCILELAQDTFSYTFPFLFQ